MLETDGVAEVVMVTEVVVTSEEDPASAVEAIDGVGVADDITSVF